MLHATGTDPTTIDPLAFVRLISGIGFTGLLVLNLLAFWRRWVVTAFELDQLRTTMQAQIDAKDAALVRKDALIESLHDENQALVQGIVEKFVPALARSALILEKFHTDTAVRRAE